MAEKKVIITDSNYPDFGIEKEILGKAGADVTRFQCTSDSEIIEKAGNPDGLLNQYAPVTRAVFEKMDNLKVVGVYGIGVNSVDLEAAEEKGVVVVNVPAYCLDEVSTHTMALLLSCIRKLKTYDEKVKSAHWSWQAGVPISRLPKKVLGLVALGKIARRVVKKAEAFGFEIIAYDPYVSEDVFEQYGVSKCYELEELIKKSDFLSIHAPLTDETEHMIGEKELEMMKPDTVLINTARGAIIDNEALYWALKGNKIAMAGLDVLENEPPLGDISQHPLIKLDNVILTPHSAWYSVDSMTELRSRAAQGVADVLNGVEPQDVVKR